MSLIERLKQLESLRWYDAGQGPKSGYSPCDDIKYKDALDEALPKLLAVLEAAKQAADTLKCVQSAICDVKAVYNDHESVLSGSGMRHDLTNLWNCSEYLEALNDTLAALDKEDV